MIVNENFQFRLAPAYCLFNGAAVLEQNGAKIHFVVENLKDEILQMRLRKAFACHLTYVRSVDGCPEEFRDLPEISFSAGDRNCIRNCVSKMFNGNENKNGYEGVEEHCVRAGAELENGGKAVSADDTETAAAVILLDSLLEEARGREASDIHIEKNTIRLRVKGRLEAYMSLQSDKASELIQRIKLLAGMNVIDRRRSQDGHFVYGNTNPLFIRVSSIPIYDESLLQEESVVLRILDTKRLPLELQLLGFSEYQLEIIEELEEMKNGLVLVCGPTGSGKSTTLASILTEIEKHNFTSKKIISLEDPPEYIIPDVCQIQVRNDGVNSYKDALMHVFRQDPDVLMIGEIRDELSCETAVRAAMTGHLVFATLHTSSAGEALLRMENLGADRRILASVLKGIICQNLEFLGAKPQLFADVAIPSEDFGRGYEGAASTEELEELFSHENNYSYGFSKSLRIMGSEFKKGRTPLRIWNGGGNGQKNYRSLG